MTSGQPEQRIAEALRARATGAGRPGGTVPSRAAGPAPVHEIRTALVLALLGGAVLGMALALLTLLVPGVLPPLG